MMMADGPEPHVQILMGTHNGAAYLPAQLDSLIAQTHAVWSLLAADDTSTDATRKILKDFAVECAELQDGGGRRHVKFFEGPGLGSGANFLTLLARADPTSYVAFCDQDDVWMPHKLSRALSHLPADGHEPAIYACRTYLTNETLQIERISTWPQRGLSFQNALVQNVLAGNTLVLSPGAVVRLQESVPAALEARVPFHDWWIYQLATGAGIQVILDPEPGLYYRQHRNNILGASRGLQAGLSRAGRVLKRDYSGWIESNVAALRGVSDLLSPEAKAILEGFVVARGGPVRRRGAALRALGIHRQTWAGDRALSWLARSGRV